MNKYFDENIKVLDLVTKYPDTLDYLMNLGFKPILDLQTSKTAARVTSLNQVCKMKHLDYKILETQLVSIIESTNSNADITLNMEQDNLQQNDDVDFYMSGLLPCPIRLSIIEAIAEDSQMLELKRKSRFDLRAASNGTKHFDEAMRNDAGKWPDAIISVGYQKFYNSQIQKVLFEDNGYMFKHPKIDKFYSNDNINLVDNKGRYFMFSYVPCIFLVNNEEIGDREVRTWDDLLEPEFENSISIPLEDLDMLNTVCLNIYKKHGFEGIKKIKKANKQSLHPAQMVVAHKQVAPPAVSVIPYFFANAVQNTSHVKVVWPEDGAYMSPIFMIARGQNQAELEVFFNFLMKSKMQNLFSANGKFPLTLDGSVQNLSENQSVQWVGWEFLNNNNIDEILKQCERIFME